ncbi:MAG: type II toxin-antitoxin system VapB family antitoxin [Actinobacteria bacterium]|nr:type II toxin-antitoxin system VapB family antitoxin [Actinomycetota bacterium]
MPFAGVISRDQGCPWGTTGLSTATWADVPVVPVTVATLTATQPGVLIAALIEAGVPVGGDEYPHVVIWQGRAYLEDGHHRVMRALIAGQRSIDARVFDMDPP